MSERPLGSRSIITHTRTKSHYHSADSHPATKPGESGLTSCHPYCWRRRAASCPRSNSDSEPTGRPGEDGATRRRQPYLGPPSHTRGQPDRSLRRAATPTRRNGMPDHTGCPAGEGARLSTGGSTKGRRVSTAVNTGSGGPQPAPGATATRNLPVAQSEKVATHRRRPNPGPPRLNSGQQDHSLRRAATRPQTATLALGCKTGRNHLDGTSCTQPPA
jgi:hypothetical protein